MVATGTASDLARRDLNTDTHQFYETTGFKDSGVEWIGRIPKHWRTQKLKRLLVEPLMYGTNEAAELEDPELPRYIRITDFDENGKLRADTFRSLALDKAMGFYLSEGDVLFARSGATVGKSFLFSEYSGEACFAGYLIRARTDHRRLLPKYLYYYTKSPVYETWKAQIFTQATIQNISATKYAYLPLVSPPLSEQHKIVAYLDKACAAIDGAIRAKQRQLEVLDDLRKSIIYQAVTRGLNENVKLKASGLDWLGDIPEGWRVTRLKNLASIRYGLGQPPQEKDDGVPMIRATNIDEGRIVENSLLRVDPDALPLERQPHLKEGEIIVVRSGALTGDSAIIPKKYAGAVAGYDMVVTVKKADPKFVSYALLSSYVLDGQLLLMTLRAAQPHLNAEELGSILVVISETIDEQKRVVQYIEAKTEQLDKLKSNLNAQIAALEQYRKSLIHECVTGKRRITEADLAKRG